MYRTAEGTTVKDQGLVFKTVKYKTDNACG